MSGTVHSFKTEADEKIEMQGHNSGMFSAEHLKQFIERIERLEAEKKTIAEDITETFKEAKGTGYDVKIMKMIMRERKTDLEVLLEEKDLMATYRNALGMLPLERFAQEQEEEENLNADIEVCGVKCKLVDFTEATIITSKVVKLIKAMHRLGGFKAYNENEMLIAEKFKELKLLKQPKEYDNLFMLTAKAEKLAAK